MKAWNRLLAGAVLAVGVCQGAQAEDKVTVFAAASLTNALQEIAAQYQQGKQVSIVTSFASSSTLARQIDQGAPADLFISADQKWMDYAIDKHAVVADTRYTLLGNQLVLVAPADSKLGQMTINAQTHWKNCWTAAVWRWAIRTTCRRGSMPRRRCRRWEPGRRYRR